jgi:hypothetical protein
MPFDSDETRIWVIDDHTPKPVTGIDPQAWKDIREDFIHAWNDPMQFDSAAFEADLDETDPQSASGETHRQIFQRLLDESIGRQRIYAVAPVY